MTKKQIKKLDDLFREYIRNRDKMRCQRCDKRTNLQVSHLISRANKHVRWNPDNAILLCAGCHKFNWAHKYPNEFTEYMIERMGEARYQELKIESWSCRKIFYDTEKEKLEKLLEEEL